MLNNQQRQRLRERLEALRTELLPALDSAAQAGQTVELDQTRQGRLSRMDAMQNQAMAQATHARASGRLQAIQRSLTELDDKDFGECKECAEPIPFGRLEIDPTVRYCVACAEALETEGA